MGLQPIVFSTSTRKKHPSTKPGIHFFIMGVEIIPISLTQITISSSRPMQTLSRQHGRKGYKAIGTSRLTNHTSRNPKWDCIFMWITTSPQEREREGEKHHKYGLLPTSSHCDPKIRWRIPRDLRRIDVRGWQVLQFLYGPKLDLNFHVYNLLSCKLPFCRRAGLLDGLRDDVLAKKDYGRTT